MQIKFTVSTVVTALIGGLGAFAAAYKMQANPITPAGWAWCIGIGIWTAGNALMHDPAPGGFRIGPL